MAKDTSGAVRLTRAARSRVRRTINRLLTVERHTFCSTSDPEKTYETTIRSDGRIYCTCPAWRFMRTPPMRTCWHARAIEKGIST